MPNGLKLISFFGVFSIVCIFITAITPISLVQVNGKPFEFSNFWVRGEGPALIFSFVPWSIGAILALNRQYYAKPILVLSFATIFIFQQLFMGSEVASMSWLGTLAWSFFLGLLTYWYLYTRKTVLEYFKKSPNQSLQPTAKDAAG